MADDAPDGAVSDATGPVDVPEIHGAHDPWFSAVRDAFADNFARGLEQGAAVCVVVDGRVVVDLWAGQASRRGGGTPWERDTLVNLYSASKGMAALCVHLLIEAGEIDLDAPVARYWPEFAAEGKAALTVAELLAHRGGLAAVATPMPHEAVYDQARIASALAAQAPLWPPGQGHGYHAQSFGFLLAELVRRVSGQSLGRFFRARVGLPLRADFHFGLGPEDDARIAQVTRPLGIAPPAGQPDLLAVMRKEPDSLTARAFGNPAPSRGAVNTRRWRAAEIPGSGGHGNARALAIVYGALADADPRLLSAAGVARCAQGGAPGPDRVLRLQTHFGHGFMVSQPAGPGHFSPNLAAFGHPGMGGSLGFADPAAGVGFGYAMNRAGASILVGDRPGRLAAAVYDCL